MTVTSQTLLRTLNQLLRSKRLLDLLVSPHNRVQWEPNPQRVEEEEVYPGIHPVTRVQVLASSKPLWRKRHETYTPRISIILTSLRQEIRV